MPRLICISNRISLPDPKTGEIQAGGLAVGVKAALESQGGGLWFGWDGSICETGKKRTLTRTDLDNITFLTIPLHKEEYENYYKSTANESLWPLMHELGEHIEAKAGAYQTFRRVNRLFARLVKPYLRPGDIIWVHDYHLIPLGRELRALGVRNRIGYFNHIPMPSKDFLTSNAVPGLLRYRFKELYEDFFYYDLVGFQSFRDFKNFFSFFFDQHPLPPRYKSISIRHHHRRTGFGVFPISIETGELIHSLKHSGCTLQKECKTLIGAERLDYTKGLCCRLQGFYEFLSRHPDARDKIKYTQITPLSRSDIRQYQATIEKTRQSVEEIRNKFGDKDGRPLSYSEKHVPRPQLMGMFRCSDAGLVTPLIDGQNLVAKEYLAVQDPRDPGTLVLSKTAGAAEELENLGTLCVDPKDPNDIADKIKTALSRPRLERIDWHRKAISHLYRYDIAHWAESFLEELASLPRAHITGHTKRPVKQTSEKPLWS